jgi:hypothetical protein
MSSGRFSGGASVKGARIMARSPSGVSGTGSKEATRQRPLGGGALVCEVEDAALLHAAKPSVPRSIDRRFIARGS